MGAGESLGPGGCDPVDDSYLVRSKRSMEEDSPRLSLAVCGEASGIIRPRRVQPRRCPGRLAGASNCPGSKSSSVEASQRLPPRLRG